MNDTDYEKVPWWYGNQPDRVSPKECIGAARDALNRAYQSEQAPWPQIAEAVDWQRRALEQMVPATQRGGRRMSYCTHCHADAADLQAKLHATEQERNAVARDLRSRSEQLDRSEPLLKRYREALLRIKEDGDNESHELARQALSDPDEEE